MPKKNDIPMANPRTICANCTHFSYEYGNCICLASPLPCAIDPVSGREMPYSVETDGRVFWHDEKDNYWNTYAYCGDVNFGDCPKYEAKEQAHVL